MTSPLATAEFRTVFVGEGDAFSIGRAGAREPHNGGEGGGDNDKKQPDRHGGSPLAATLSRGASQWVNGAVVGA